MKARSYPLKADHTILPVQRDNPELLSRPGVPLNWPYLTGKDGVSVCKITSLSGNHGDSSGSDSVCAPRRCPGQSPTRVRFEDESETDAEIRYLERRRQRAVERAPALLMSKPHFSSFVGKKNESAGSANGTLTGEGCSPEGRGSWHAKPQRCGAPSHCKPRMPQDVLARQCKLCGTVLPTEVTNHNLNPNLFPQKSYLHRNPPDPLDGILNCATTRVPCWVHFERIKETYIGTVVPPAKGDGHSMRRGLEDKTTERDGKAGSQLPITKMRVRRCSQKGELEGTCRFTVPVSPDESNLTPPVLTNGTVALPPNPYAVEQRLEGPVLTPHHLPGLVTEARTLGTPKSIPSSPLHIKPALKSGLRSQCNGQQEGKKSLEALETGTIAGRQEVPFVEGGDGDVLEVGVSSAPTSCGIAAPPSVNPTIPTHCSDPAQTPGEHHDAVPLTSGDLLGTTECCIKGESNLSSGRHRTSDKTDQGQLGQESQRDDAHSPVESGKDADLKLGRSKLSLKGFFSAIGLNGVGTMSKRHSRSLEQLSFLPSSNQASPGPKPSLKDRLACPPDNRQLRKAPSLQSLHLGSPFLEMRKSSSIQNLQMPKNNQDRSSAYIPGDLSGSPIFSRSLRRPLSVEDVGCPSEVRCVGRVAQTFPDGTLLLELNRRSDGPFGFFISRGKGRPDSGVYVEEMADSNTEKLYTGLLGIGDEILEVNQEKVAGLSLDLVTQLMTKDNITSVRVLPHWKPPPL